jgi:thioesterase domain-containing protein/acyl carrier protein
MTTNIADTRQLSHSQAQVSARPQMSETQSKLERIWADALQLPSVAHDADFFDIGGDSLIAAVMVDQIYRVFGRRVPINILFEAPTIAQLSAFIDRIDPRPSLIVPIRPSGNKTPVFCFHSLGGSVLGYYNLARHLPADYPVWAVQPRGTDGSERPITSIPEMAKHYTDEIMRVQDAGAFIVTGISLGAEIAFEVARELKVRGREVKQLVLIDAATPLYRRVAPTVKVMDVAKKRWQALFYAITMRRRGRLTPQQARGRIYQNNIRAARAYRNSRPSAVNVPASLIRAKYQGNYHMPEEAIAEWHRLTGGLTAVTEVHGAHSGKDYVLDEPNVGAVASAFLTALERGK